MAQMNGVSTPTMDTLNNKGQIAKRGRGRPPKNEVVAAPVVKRGRGRPPKNETAVVMAAKKTVGKKKAPPAPRAKAPLAYKRKAAPLTVGKAKSLSVEELQTVKELLMKALGIMFI